MSSPFHKLIEVDLLYKIIKKAKDGIGEPHYLADKHQLVFEQQAEELKIRLPLHFTFTHGLEEMEERPFMILMVESGHAALAYGEGEQIIEHKVFKSYMVRKKQGKSQLKHLKTKGKSKAGSRVRLANTEHFFEEIHEKVAEWLEYYEVDYIALSCSKTLYPYLFTEEFELNRKDERIIKIPKHIPEANFENLLKIHSYLLKAEVIGEEERVKALLNS